LIYGIYIKLGIGENKAVKEFTAEESGRLLIVKETFLGYYL
jgi:hypothetical protein